MRMEAVAVAAVQLARMEMALLAARLPMEEASHMAAAAAAVRIKAVQEVHQPAV
ncbi:MAG: hypothetical protein WC989_05710 [Micavibrio sp.]